MDSHASNQIQNNDKTNSRQYSSMQEALVLKDYEMVYHYRINYANMRFAALGACITILGLLASLADSSKYLALIGIFALMLVISFAGIRLIATLNRAMYIFANHLQWVEEKEGIQGFSVYWPKYLGRTNKNSGSYGFMIATRALNITVTIYVVAGSITSALSTNISRGYSLLGLACALLAIVALILNEDCIYRQLNPRNYVEIISRELDSIRKTVFSKDGNAH